MVRTAIRAAVAAGLAAALAWGAGTAPPPQASLLPGKDGAGAWAPAAPAEVYERDGLFGYIDGGAEIFLQYGFERLELGRYALPAAGTAREITCEIYRMGSAAEAFGIFSVKREGSEGTSASLPSPNIFDSGQASFVRGPYYVNILGTETSAPDMGAFARAVAARIPAAGADPLPALARLPRENFRPRTERFLQGELAAQAESDLLADPLWRFAGGTTAVSARYGEPPARLILIELASADPGWTGRVRELLAGVLGNAEMREGVVEARNAAGHPVLFASRGRSGALVLGRGDVASARRLLSLALQ